MLPITIEGITYKSIAEAWRTLSPKTLKLINVRLRLRNGWSPLHALTAPTVPAKYRRTNKELRLA